MTQKIKVSITVIIALLFPNSRLVLCQLFLYNFTNIRNLPKILLRSFENVGPVYSALKGIFHTKKAFPVALCTSFKKPKIAVFNLFHSPQVLWNHCQFILLLFLLQTHQQTTTVNWLTTQTTTQHVNTGSKKVTTSYVNEVVSQDFYNHLLSLSSKTTH